MHDSGASVPENPLLRAARLGTWELDLSTMRVTWSSSLEEMHGIPVGSFEGTFEAYQRDIHPEDRVRVLATIEGNLASRQGHSLFYRIVRPDGAVRWLDAHGEFMKEAQKDRWRLVGVCADVTELLLDNVRRAFLADVTRALVSSLDYDKSLQTVARLTVPRIADWCAVDVFVDPQDRSLGLQRLAMAHVDPAKVELGREILRRFPTDVTSPVFVQMVRSGEPLHIPAVTRQMLVDAGRGPDHVELAEQLGLCSLIAAPIELRGVVIGVLTVATAESHRTLAREDVACVRELCTTTAVALENARLYREAKEEARTREDVVGIVSHDLRTPLAAIVLGASSLLRREDVDDKTTATARRILSSADRASRLVRDLLDFTQARASRIPIDAKLIELDDVVLTAVEEVRAVHPERTIELQTVRLQGQWDRDRLLQVFTNLLGNAVEHSRPGDRVRVSMSSNREAVVDVHNEGDPIPVELHARIFEPFSRGRGPERQSRGLGLGLYIASEIVRSHGGRIELRCAPSMGTTFTVRLPRA